MMAMLGLLMMAASFWVATRLGPESLLAHRAGSAMAAGAGVLLVLAGTVRPELTPLAVSAVCVCLLWLALSPPLQMRKREAKSRGEVR
jgi:thiol:disulfide interchange protein